MEPSAASECPELPTMLAPTCLVKEKSGLTYSRCGVLTLLESAGSNWGLLREVRGRRFDPAGGLWIWELGDFL